MIKLEKNCSPYGQHEVKPNLKCKYQKSDYSKRGGFLQTAVHVEQKSNLTSFFPALEVLRLD